MIEVNSPIGNIFDKGFEQNQENYEKLKVTRMELEKRILRRKTDHGTDVGLNLTPGVKLRNGDIIKNDERKIAIEQLPEKIISVKVKTNTNDVLVLLGHIIGNRHRPISIQNDGVLFPIQADSEEEVFRKLFHSIIDYIEMKVEERIFLPHSGADVHEH